MNKLLITILCLFPATLFAQQSAIIQGKIMNESGNSISYATITYNNQTFVSNEQGVYSIKIPANDSITIYFACYGYETFQKIFNCNENETTNYSAILKQNAIDIPKVHIIYNKEQEENITYLNSEKMTNLPGLSLLGIEGTIKTLPGVSSKSELSSQYSVRGGSYDENLVYINGIPAYKPIIASSDQQEGLSIINPYMVEKVEFSSGGFGAQYGDKMSSVLNVYYKEVTNEQIQFDASLLDANITFQGLADSCGFSYILGTRYKNTSLILDSLDARGEYKPAFFDIQSLLRYKINSKFKIAYWLYGANNSYSFAPDKRITDFGGLEKQFRMTVYFEGEEKYTYSNIGNALSFYYTPKERTFLDFNAMYYTSLENENFDILSQYRLSEIIKDQENQQSSKDSTSLLAVGSFLEHGRNKLQTQNIHFSHNGKQIYNFLTITWGGSIAFNKYDGSYNEWTYIDSANYAIPYSDTVILLKNIKNATIPHTQVIGTAYISASKRIDFKNTKQTSLKINTGLRSTYDDYSQKILYNPRIRILCKPSLNNSLAISFASGIYYQIPQYKELISEDGIFYTNVLPQKSTHYVLGVSKKIIIWNRPFILQTEAYFKKLHNIIPYTIQNVSTVYYPELLADGYTTGIESKLNGEFVPGIESWINFSCMKSREHLINNVSDEIRRPNDQRVNFGLFFQDYLPGSEHVKMNLTYFLGTEIPTATPNSTYNEFDDHDISMYSRLDLGLLMIIIGNPSKPAKKIIKNLTLGAEIFNLFDSPNKISYFWIEDVNELYYGIPNFLPSRRFNLKLSIKI